MNVELNNELQQLHVELTKLKSVSELLNGANNSVSNTAKLSEKLLNGFTELSVKVSDFIDKEIGELKKLKVKHAEDFSVLRADLIDEIQTHKNTIQSQLKKQADTLEQNINQLIKEFKDTSSHEFAIIDDFRSRSKSEIKQLSVDVRKEVSEIIKDIKDQNEKSFQDLTLSLEKKIELLIRQNASQIASVKDELSAELNNKTIKLIDQFVVIKKEVKTSRVIQVVSVILSMIVLVLLAFKI